MSNEQAPILVAACGNRLAGDDAFGPLLADLLQREPLEGVEAVDLGMSPGGLLDLLDGAGRMALVIVDAAVAVDVGPGTLIDCEWDWADRPVLTHERAVSTHGLSIANQVELARSIGMLPRVVRLVAVAAAQGPRAQNPVSPDHAIIRQLAPARERIGRLARKVLERSLTEMRYV